MTGVCVVGAGLMGHGIAQVFMTAGHDVRIHDPDPATLAAVPDRIRGHLRQLAQDTAVNVRLADSLADAVGGAEPIVEAIPQDLPLKQQLGAQLDDLAHDTITATNTSVLHIGEIAAGSGLRAWPPGARENTEQHLLEYLAATEKHQ